MEDGEEIETGNRRIRKENYITCKGKKERKKEREKEIPMSNKTFRKKVTVRRKKERKKERKKYL